MFETATPTGEYEQGQWHRRRRLRRRRRMDYGDEPSTPQGPSPYQSEDESFEEESFEEEDEEAGEDQFLPLIAAGLSLLPAVLGGLAGGGRRKTESEYAEEGEDEHDLGEEERFLEVMFKEILGETGYQEAALTPSQEAEYAGRLLEVTGEEELRQVLAKIVNAVGTAFQGVRGAASSPQGQALVEALVPVARTTVPGAGAVPPSEVFETAAPGMSQEQDVFEAARRCVRLAATAAQNVAAAPPGAPPEVVGELGIFRAASQIARPLFKSAVRAVSPIIRHATGLLPGIRHATRLLPGIGRAIGAPGFGGGPRGGPHSGIRYAGPVYGGYRGPRYYGGYRGPRYFGGYRVRATTAVTVGTRIRLRPDPPGRRRNRRPARRRDRRSHRDRLSPGSSG